MIDKSALLEQAGPPEADVEIPGVGTVRVRGLTRVEVLSVRKAADNDPASVDGPRILVLERKMLATALVEPEMTEADIHRWQDVAPAGQIEPVTVKVQELSGLLEGADKATFPEVRADA